MLTFERLCQRHWKTTDARRLVVRHQHRSVVRPILRPRTWLHTTLSWCIVREWHRLCDVVLDDRESGITHDETVWDCVGALLCSKLVTPNLRTVVCRTGPSGGVLAGPAVEALAQRRGTDTTVRIDWSGEGAAPAGSFERQSIGLRAMCAARNVHLVVRDAPDWMQTLRIHLTGQLRAGNNLQPNAFWCHSLRVDLHRSDGTGILETLAAVPSLRRLEFSARADPGAAWDPFDPTPSDAPVNRHLECLRLCIPGRGSGRRFVEVCRRCLRSFPGLRRLTLDVRGLTVTDADLRCFTGEVHHRHRLQHTRLILSAHPKLTAVGVGCWRDCMRQSSERTAADGCSMRCEVDVVPADTPPPGESPTKRQRWRPRWFSR